MVTVLYFAALRERLGRASDWIDLEKPLPAGDLLARLRAADPVVEAAFSVPGTIRVAVGQRLADEATIVNPGDEVAFFPPMTGG
ncbi:MoaD/ThiS family protein [Acetobacter sp. AN02]|uniref:MoaD/ThiS family protein n=1 Tax=Acetobacter sp. AN02 TaxID=2894186 RepID=UPI0024345B16|nr:MoaD/ThiS family protein [Acetobacter sp. AN02]MDG6095184.1 MoaD/ThiS family protein [Acetobacter sp. AN02]